MQSNEQIIDAFKLGKTLQEIASFNGISRQRIHQIISSSGLRRCDGGAWLRTTKREARICLADKKYIEKWGISRVQRKEMQSMQNDPFLRFLQQKNNAQTRGISFTLTFTEWWKIWFDSGLWQNRGIRGYVMARFGDTGSYCVGNVHLITSADNGREYQAIRKSRIKQHLS